MRFFIDYLSGNVPGGFLALFFLLLTVNVALYFLFKSSKLFDKQIYKQKRLRYNTLILSLYIFLWFYLQPPRLPETVIFMPFTENGKINTVYPEILQEHLADRLADGYRLYRWEWLYQTANPDSFALEEYRSNLAKKLGLNVVLAGKIMNRTAQTPQVECSLWKNGTRIAVETMEAPSSVAVSRKMIQLLDSAGDIIERNRVTVIAGDDIYWEKWARAKWALEQRKYDELTEIIEPVDLRTKTILSEYFLLEGKQLTEKNSDSKLTTDDKNPHFQRILSWLIPFSRDEKDNALMNVILGRLYLHKQNYGMAEVCLKRAVTQDQFDSRIFFYMSFLHPSRIKEIGFDDRIALLEHTVRLDPGYIDALYELANELYSTGTAAASGHSTQRALRLLTEYQNINGNQQKILSLLGRIYLQSKFTLNAFEIFKKLVDLFPDSAENHYNLGICNYQLKHMDLAEANFRRALQINEHLESYLYLGAIYRQREQYDKALYYFRERIRRKTGNDDYYAKEAMRQVRVILDILSDSLSQGSMNAVQTPRN